MKLVYNFVHGRVIICHRKSISYFDFGFTPPYGTHFKGFTIHKCWLIWWFKDVMIALISHPQYLPYEWQYITSTSLQWRNNGRDGVSNQQPYHCLLTCLFRSRSKEISLAFVRGIHRLPLNSQQNWPVTRKMIPFDDVIMLTQNR